MPMLQIICRLATGLGLVMSEITAEVVAIVREKHSDTLI
jgi:hypothetical protein